MNHIDMPDSLLIGRWDESALNTDTDAHTFTYDDELSELPIQLSAQEASGNRTVVVRSGDEIRINALLDDSLCRVLIGEATFIDEDLIKRLVDRFGSERIGLWLPVQLFESNWSLDSESNADFNVIAVTNPVPRWNLLDTAGEPRDIDAFYYAKKMIAQGAGAVMLEVSNPQDEDLTVCAELSEVLGDKLWLSSNENEWDYWVRYSGVTRLVLPRDDALDLSRLEVVVEEREPLEDIA
ncbi:MAG: hypothetical protein OEL79_07295 [Chromatiales bacterium]|nr:hypothetical protein [Chromatiales bacterium]